MVISAEKGKRVSKTRKHSDAMKGLRKTIRKLASATQETSVQTDILAICYAENIIDSLALLKFSIKRETIASLDRDYAEYICKVFSDWDTGDEDKLVSFAGTGEFGEKTMAESVLNAVAVKARNGRWVLRKEIKSNVE